MRSGRHACVPDAIHTLAAARKALALINPYSFKPRRRSFYHYLAPTLRSPTFYRRRSIIGCHDRAFSSPKYTPFPPLSFHSTYRSRLRHALTSTDSFAAAISSRALVALPVLTISLASSKARGRHRQGFKWNEGRCKRRSGEDAVPPYTHPHPLILSCLLDGLAHTWRLTFMECCRHQRGVGRHKAGYNRERKDEGGEVMAEDHAGRPCGEVTIQRGARHFYGRRSTRLVVLLRRMDPARDV
ncbi:hypothetical protein R3P38DRAFT_1840570 [Favolaschia claudopus]|uniref:Uncharacterized protein n=1 Tax=Favolaschia claudopus TaxID=2862362 RepID=A0AAW0A3B0_9AGAR